MIFRIGLDEKPEAWQRAIERAMANGCEGKVSHQWTEHSKVFGTESLFLVASNSMPGACYNVHFVNEDGVKSTSCNCPAGWSGHVCWHAAGAMLMAGHIVQPDPDPEPDVQTADAGAELAYVFGGSYRDDLIAGNLA